MHERVPKSSHCNACGHCVLGWDHHCDLLNNCVGRRNIRSFVLFLLFSHGFAGCVFLTCLVLLTFGRPDYCSHSWLQNAGLLLAWLQLGLLNMVLHRFFKTPGRKNKLLLAITISYFVSTLSLSRSVAAALAFVLMAVSVVYIMTFRMMVADYLDLISRKLT